MKHNRLNNVLPLALAAGLLAACFPPVSVYAAGDEQQPVVHGKLPAQAKRQTESPFLLASAKTTAGGRAADADLQLPSARRDTLAETLKRLVFGTVAVLLCAVLAIVISRRWMGIGPGESDEAQLEIIKSLRLNRGVLHLVHVDNQRVLVAQDGTGIKSVLPVTQPFGDMLQPSDSQEATDSATGLALAWADERTTTR